jgi:quinol monooxygenase YgiN
MDFTELKNSLSLEETNERIRQIEDRLHRSLSHNSSRFHTDQNGVSEDQHSAYDASRPENNGPSSFDWTRIYAYSEKYEDIEALRAEVSSEERKARETAEKALLSSAHSHDHAEVRGQ